MNLSDEEIILIWASLNSRKRRYWVHDINRKRRLFGEYAQLCTELSSYEDRFYQYFRMSEESFEEIHTLVKDRVKKMDTNWRKAISTRERLAICFRYMATGDSFNTIATSFRVGHSTVSKIVKETSEEIWNVLQPIYLATPTAEDWKKIEKGYTELWQFPNCLGGIDGKHVYVQCPPNSGSTYFCYKKRFSFILLAIVDPFYKFIIVDIGAYGKESDNTVFENSTFYRTYILGNEILPPKPLPGFSDPVPHVFIGDEGFALEKYIMRPYDKRSATADPSLKVFNNALSRARRITESTFGIMVQKWRVFLRPMQCHVVDTAISVVKAAVCIHNLLRTKNEITLRDLGNVQTVNTLSLSAVTSFTLNTRRTNIEAYNIRDMFKTYFNLQ